MSKADDNIIEGGMGHNSLHPEDLRNYCERLEKLMEERKSIGEDIKAVLEEADMNGFHKKTLKDMVKFRALDAEERRM
jgi:uncharacterized protein (UPF0335 family)